MTKRNEQLKAYHDYQEALREAEGKKPEGPWRKVLSDDGAEETMMIYDPAEDILELALTGSFVKIPGKYLRSLYLALGDLVG